MFSQQNPSKEHFAFNTILVNFCKPPFFLGLKKNISSGAQEKCFIELELEL